MSTNIVLAVDELETENVVETSKEISPALSFDVLVLVGHELTKKI